MMRTRCYKDGDRLFRVACSCPDSEYDDQSKLILAPLHNFTLVEPTGEPFAEPVASITLPGHANVQFDIPETYPQKRTANPRPGLTIVAYETESADAWAGEIHVGFAAASTGLSIGDVHLAQIEHLRSRKLDVFDSTIQPIEQTGPYRSASFVTANLVQEDSPYQAPFLLLEHETGIAIIGMISGRYENDPIWASINKRAFEIVRDSLAVQVP